jgi:hypothetical protein
MEQHLLTLNVLNFSFTGQTLSCYLTLHETAKAVKLSEKDVNFFIHHLQLPQSTTDIYTTFDVPCPNGMLVTLHFEKNHPASNEKLWSFSFLKRYYSFKLSTWFKSRGIAVKGNFVSDTEVWIPGISTYQDCKGYKSFRLRVQFNRLTAKPELLVSYDGVHSVYKKSLASTACQELEPTLFGWMMYENDLFRYDDMPDKARRNDEAVFPCLNKRLQRALKIPFPAPDKSNRYLRYQTEIENFRKQYLEADELSAFMHLNEHWITRESLTLLSEKKPLNMLLFGNDGQDAQPKNGMKLYGPRLLSPNRKTVFFFICHVNDVDMAKTINDFMGGQVPGFGGVNKYCGLSYSTVKKLSIYFNDKENPLEEIVTQLDKRELESDTRYVALYLSPFGKWDSEEAHRAVYYHVKEELLHRGIVSQAIEVEKNWTDRQTSAEKKAILKKGFNYAFPNIAVALLAKLGGTPWSLANEPGNELVIGISAFKSEELENKYLGSAFSFSGEGRFCGFDCFRSNQVDELAGSILMAVKAYCSEHQKLERLIIHFYKTLSRKELAPIENGLAKLGLSIPVVVLTINKTLSEDIVGFDMNHTHLMPYSYTYLPIGHSQYLLYNNGLRMEEVFDPKEGYPFPLKVSLQHFPVDSTQSEALDESLIPALFEQTCQFSQLYWKSISRQSLPVTLRYPEMLAQMVPHFSRPELPKTGKETLWFL